ncbi:MAG: ArsR family transcriptional regulator [Alphaproteobacteria bacterium]
MSFAAFLDESRRLAVLRLLRGQENRSLNDSVLKTSLRQLGFTATYESVQADIAWLAERKLLRCEIIGDKVHVATLTDRGADVVAGQIEVEGVQFPSDRG